MTRPAPTDLSLSPVLLGLLACVGGVIVMRVRASRRRVERLGALRVLALTAAVGLLLTATVSPVATLGGAYLLTMHLVEVMLLMGFVPPLLLLGLPRPGPRALPGPLRIAGAVAVHPAVAIVTVNLVLFGWHAPRLYNMSLEHPDVYALQGVSLLLASVAFWWPIVEPNGPGRWSLSPLYKLGYILLATIPQTFAGLIFALAHRVFYDAYASAPPMLGMSHLVDQQIAGACMALVSKLALFAAFSVVLWRMLDGQPAEDEASDDGGGPGGGHNDDAPAPERPPSPAWLGLLGAPWMPDEPAPVQPSEREPVTAGR